MKKRIFALVLALGMLAGCTMKGKPSGSGGNASSSTAKPKYEQVTVYLPNDNADGLLEKKVQVEESDDMAAALVQTLEAEGAVPSGSDVRKWSVSKKDPTTLKVDLNEEFAEGMLSTGTAGETVMMGSLVNTLWTYFDPDEIILTANGQPIETGHNIYEDPFTEPITVS